MDTNAITIFNAFLALFAILNPIGVMPVFADLANGLDRRTRMKLFNTAMTTAFTTMVVMTFTGRWIMTEVFRISIVEFRIAGGIIMLVVAIRYIIFPPPKTTVDINDTDSLLQMAVSPLGVPILVGPGTIVTAILVYDRDGAVVSLIAIAALFVVTWAIIQLSPVFNRLLGEAGRIVLSKILWIFIAAIGVNFLLSGIKEAFGL